MFLTPYLLAFCHYDRVKKSYPLLSCRRWLPNGAYELIIKKREKRRKREEKERKREERKKRRREGWLKWQCPSKQRERG
jgi:hypothetical protein